MKMACRILAALLAILMIVGMFAGCQQHQTGTTGSNGDNSTTGNGEPEKHYLTATVTADMRVGDWIDREKFPVFQRFNEMLEERGLYVTWNVVERDQYTTFLTTGLAAPDTLTEYLWLDGYINAAQKVECVESGLFCSIDEILKYSDGTAVKYYQDHPEIKGKVGYKGELWWLPEVMNYTIGGEVKPWGEPVGLLVREDWLTKLNMDIPTTPEAFEAYMAACQANDMNGNGVVDEYYLRNFDTIDYGIASMYGVPSSYYGLNPTTAEVVSTYEMAETKEYYKFMQNLVAKGYIKQDYVGVSDYPSGDEKENKSAATWNYYCNNWTIAGIMLPEGTPTANYVGCIPSTEKGYIQHDGSPLMDARAAVFTKNLKDPKAAAILLDVMCSEEFAELSVWGIEGVTYTVDANGNRAYVEDATNPELGKLSGIAYGRDIWGFGQLPVPNLTTSMDPEMYELYCTTEKMAEVNQIGCKTAGTYTTHADCYMQTPTQEEAEIMTELSTELTTIYKQLHTDLLLGRIDVDTEWDSKVVQPLKEAGLDELLAVYQARANRYAGK